MLKIRRLEANKEISELRTPEISRAPSCSEISCGKDMITSLKWSTHALCRRTVQKGAVVETKVRGGQNRLWSNYWENHPSVGGGDGIVAGGRRGRWQN